MDTKKSLSYQHIVFALLAIVVFYKCMLFHNLCFESTPEKLNFGFYLPKIAVSLYIASFAYLFNRQWWSVVVLLIIDTWCFANLTYFRANNLLLTLDAIRMAGNLHGFEGSIKQYTDLSSFVFYISTALYAAAIFIISRFTSKKRLLVIFSIAFGLGLLCSIMSGICLFKNTHDDSAHFRYEYLNPFITQTELTEKEWQKERQNFNYVVRHSIITYAVNMLHEGRQEDKIRQRDIEYTDEEKQILSKLAGTNTTDTIVPKYNLVFVLVESFESWTLELTDKNGNPVTPNTLKLLNSRPALYCHNGVSQTKHGVSGDGQMICNSGLLPIQSGAACMLYGHNTYPAYAHLYPQSTLVNPCSNTWNQNAMSKNYGYKKQLTITENSRYTSSDTENWWNDSTIFSNTIKDIRLNAQTEPFCYFILTLSSHTPFHFHDKSYNLELNGNWSESAQNYIGAIHYMDRFLGDLINFMDSTRMFDNTLLVITSDHTIFVGDRINDLVEGARQDGISVADGRNYVPIIMTGAGINESRVIDEGVYQMDIYPTILKCIGAENYYWKGFGADLNGDYEGSIYQSRQIHDYKAYELSDKLIRDNYFGKL